MLTSDHSEISEVSRAMRESSGLEPFLDGRDNASDEVGL